MSTGGKTSQALVNRFVSYLNETGFEAKFPKDVPEDLRTATAAHGMVYWKIRAAQGNKWVTDMDERLPQRLPDAYRYLIERYRFSSFEVGPIMFFANSGNDLFYELFNRLFQDNSLSVTLRANGFLQFGMPQETNFDPVCFDMRRRKRGDAPIVQLDHEDILIRNRIRVVRELATSFCTLMRSAIEQRLPVH